MNSELPIEPADPPADAAENADDPQNSTVLSEAEKAALLGLLAGVLEASGRLETSYVPVMIRAAAAWMDHLRDQQRPYGWDDLERAGEVMLWRDGGGIAKAVVGQIRANPSVQLKLFSVGPSAYKLNPLGRFPKGWKDLTLSCRHGAPKQATMTETWRLAQRVRGHGVGEGAGGGMSRSEVRAALTGLRPAFELLAARSGERDRVVYLPRDPGVTLGSLIRAAGGDATVADQMARVDDALDGLWRDAAALDAHLLILSKAPPAVALDLTAVGLLADLDALVAALPLEAVEGAVGPKTVRVLRNPDLLRLYGEKRDAVTILSDAGADMLDQANDILHQATGAALWPLLPLDIGYGDDSWLLDEIKVGVLASWRDAEGEIHAARANLGDLRAMDPAAADALWEQRSAALAAAGFVIGEDGLTVSPADEEVVLWTNWEAHMQLLFEAIGVGFCRNAVYAMKGIGLAVARLDDPRGDGGNAIVSLANAILADLDQVLARAQEAWGKDIEGFVAVGSGLFTVASAALSPLGSIAVTGLVEYGRTETAVGAIRGMTIDAAAKLIRALSVLWRGARADPKVKERLVEGVAGVVEDLVPATAEQAIRGQKRAARLRRRIAITLRDHESFEVDTFVELGSKKILQSPNIETPNMIDRESEFGNIYRNYE